MSDSKSSISSGMSLPGILLVIFVVLKLTGNVTWSWFWVLSPLWISVLIALIALVLVAIVGGVVTIGKQKRKVIRVNKVKPVIEPKNPITPEVLKPSDSFERTFNGKHIWMQE